MKKSLRKNFLTEIAYKLFITKGYESTSVDEIVTQAKIAKGTFYYYFESKEQILEEVINFMINNEVENAKKILTSDLSIENKLVGIVLTLRPRIDEEEIKNIVHHHENVIMHKKINEKIIDEATPLLSEVIRQGVKENLFKCDSIEERVKLILIMSNELFDGSNNNYKYTLVFIDTVEKMLGAKPGTLNFIKKLIDKEQI